MKVSILNFKKMLPAVAELFHVDRWTDRHAEPVAVCAFQQHRTKGVQFKDEPTFYINKSLANLIMFSLRMFALLTAMSRAPVRPGRVLRTC